MKLKVFQSDHGDCCLVTGNDGTRVLVDGGLYPSYKEFVAPYMGRLRSQGHKLDLVCVSHIDQDHIAGVLQMLNDEAAWRVYDYQRDIAGNGDFRRPENPRPPQIEAIWHNSFHDQIKQNAGPIADLLAANAAILSGDDDIESQELAEEFENLATSEREAIRLSRRIGEDQLGIKLNGPWKGKLAMIRSRTSIEVGGLSLTLIGPFKEDVENLRDAWNQWLSDNGDTVRRLRREAEHDAENMGNSVGALFPLLEQAKKIGNRQKVTAPNLASIMFLLEESDRSILFTGDGHADEVIKGLEYHGRLLDDPMHVDVMKMPHHGAEPNWTDELAKRVLADHYVFCGNGHSTNPETIVIQSLVDARKKDGGSYKLWFNSDSSLPGGKEAYRQHMAKVRSLVEKLAAKSKGQMTYRFLTTGSFQINL